MIENGDAQQLLSRRAVMREGSKETWALAFDTTLSLLIAAEE